MLRLLIILGVSLMLVGFGAAGWQYWQSLPASQVADPAVAKVTEEAPKVWLISETGGPVAEQDVRAYLAQNHSIPERSAEITMTAALSDLLTEGETLPEPAYLEVMADIRATVLAEALCPVLTSAFAAKCGVASARVVPGSVDAMQGTARFRISLSFAVTSGPDDLPDLALNVFRGWQVDLPPGATARTTDAALADLAAAATAACAAPDVGQSCRVLRLSLDHASDGSVAGQVSLGTLFPLPEGMQFLPEILPAPKG